jgi:hypothetical protein
MSIPLADALSVLAPHPRETQLLQACLQHGAVSPEAWATDADRERSITRTRQILAPLLAWSLRNRGSVPDGGLGSYLRAAALNEEVRWREYQQISHAALRSLGAAGITPVVVGGAALAETVYPYPAARHCDSLVLLVPGPDLLAAARHLEREGFVSEPGARSGTSKLRHSSGMRLFLRSQLLAAPMFRVPTEAVWSRAVVTDLARTRTRRLSSADALFQVCVDGLLMRNPRVAQWAADAWYVIDRSADLSWDSVVARAREARAELPLVVALRYLAEVLGAPVPAWARQTLGAAATRAGSSARDACLYATRRVPPIPGGRLLAACGTWQSRLLILKWLLCPAPEALRLYEPATRQRSLSAAYCLRFWRIARSCGRMVIQRLPTLSRVSGSERPPIVITKAGPR